MNWSDSKLVIPSKFSTAAWVSSFKNIEIKKFYDHWQNVNLIDICYKNNDEDKG